MSRARPPLMVIPMLDLSIADWKSFKRNRFECVWEGSIGRENKGLKKAIWVHTILPRLQLFYLCVYMIMKSLHSHFLYRRCSLIDLS